MIGYKSTYVDSKGITHFKIGDYSEVVAETCTYISASEDPMLRVTTYDGYSEDVAFEQLENHLKTLKGDEEISIESIVDGKVTKTIMIEIVVDDDNHDYYEHRYNCYDDEEERKREEEQEQHEMDEALNRCIKRILYGIKTNTLTYPWVPTNSK